MAEVKHISKKFVQKSLQRNHKKDLDEVIQFCKEKGIQIGCSLVSNSRHNFENRYMIRRECTDGDEITYYLMEDDMERFSISMDFYDLKTNIIEELTRKCIEYNI